mmetsp:Transcript_8052/g.20186  ORF Transcript_8052/g.20186 Transcript_8052/m.20186 type:complete len:1010 (-) Transcript_8052:591-3620(-)
MVDVFASGRRVQRERRHQPPHGGGGGGGGKISMKMATSTLTSSFRPFFAQLFLLCVCLTSLFCLVASEEGGSTNHTADVSHGSGEEFESALEEAEHEDELEHELEEPYAVLYPSFILVFGTIIYYILTRYIAALPYTACMFILGTMIGIGVSWNEFVNPANENHIHQSVVLWQGINSEVLLLVFLPGLIFKDSLGQNVHLFDLALGQLLIFAFPMVLAGTVLTALVAYYILPYTWSFNLCMTFGSILSATDPVAVAALLEEVGAPPRLKTHIAGESLLNDGAAIVFYSIFAEKFFFEQGIPGFGQDIGWAEGVGIFCQKALGGFACGIFFGLGTLLLVFLLDKRFSHEENIVQVTAVLAMAYLNYYVSDFVWSTSGVIATLTQGLIVRLIGRSAINDPHLFDDFFVMMEHILNTILFSLGGLVWGGVVVENHRDGIWQGKEWGFLILLYILLHVIRALLFVSVYPITVRIGLSTSWPETIFQIYGGLRGAVGIALAISLDSEVSEVFGGNDISLAEKEAATLYQFVGGIAFLTLIINGSTAGPVLRKLGLVDSTETRNKIIDAYRIHFRAEMIDSFVELLTNDRFKHVDYALVKSHVPLIADMTLEQLTEAVQKLKDATPEQNYHPPHLEHVLPYFKPDGMTDEDFEKMIDTNLLIIDPAEQKRKMRIMERKKSRRTKRRSVSSMAYLMQGEPFSTAELRVLFISMIRAQYEYQMKNGELESQHLLAIALEQSLEEAETDCNKGLPLNDLEHLQEYHRATSNFFRRTKKYTVCCDSCVGVSLKNRFKKRSHMHLKQKADALYVEQAMAFVSAHKRAQFFFKEQIMVGAGADIVEAAKVVLAESQKEIEKATNDLDNKLDRTVVHLAASHKFCKILLNRGIAYVDKLAGFGLLKESEAEEMVEELEELLDHVISCDLENHEGEMDIVYDEVEGTPKEGPCPSTLNPLPEEIDELVDANYEDENHGGGDGFLPESDQSQVERVVVPDSDNAGGNDPDFGGGEGPGVGRPEL